MRYAALILIALSALTLRVATAQSLPERPHPTISVNVKWPDHLGIERVTLDVPHRTADAAWFTAQTAMLSVTAADTALAWKWKREDDACRANGIVPQPAKWYYLHIVATAPHVVGIALSLARR